MFRIVLGDMSCVTIERISIMFTSKCKREFVPRDQVSPLFVFYYLLFQHIN